MERENKSKKKISKESGKKQKAISKKKCRFKKYISTVQLNIDKKNVINL